MSIRAQVLNLLADIQEEFGLTYLIIAHDLALVERKSRYLLLRRPAHALAQDIAHSTIAVIGAGVDRRGQLQERPQQIKGFVRIKRGDAACIVLGVEFIECDSDFLLKKEDLVKQ